MSLFSLVKSFVSTLLFAVGQLFAWLNRRDARKADHETKQRIADNMAAAARPNPHNADRLNRWLARGRSHRLRDRQEPD